MRRLLLTRPTAVVVVIVIALLEVGTGSLFVAGALPPSSPGPFQIPWPVLGVLFGASQLVVLNVQIRRESRSVFLSEIPLALALVFSPPAGLLLGRMLGAAVFVGVRRQYKQPIKLAFNAALAFAEGATGLLVYRLVLGAASPVHVRGWLAVEAANIVASCFAGVAVSLVIQLIENDVELAELAKLLPSIGLQTAVISTLGCVAVVALAADPWAAALLVAACVALFVAYRAYGTLNERHLSLERVYRFTQALASTPEMSEVLIGVLQQARELLQAEHALVRFSTPDQSEALEVTLGRAGSLDRGPARVLDDPEHPLVASAFSGTAAALLPRNGRDPATREWLSQRRLRELLAVPLRGDSGVVAVLAVADRLGEARGFDREDVRLLETVANHAAIALQNGRLVDQLRHDSLHDALTHLPNRKYFTRELDEQIAELPAGKAVVVGILDLDSFKDVNDTLGHARGDDLLREVALRLSSAAHGRAVVARLGGDEFAVLFDADNEDAALRFGRSLVASLHQPVLLGDVEVEVGGSLGLALSSCSGTERVTLLKHADIAMYSAKQSGFDVQLYDASLDRSAPTRLALVGRLRTAISAGGLEVYVQPQASLATGEVIGAEALVRWKDAERGWISPEEFIPLAERSGLIRPLTELVLRKSIKACAGWQADLPGVGVAVNLSVRSLTDDGLVGQVERLLARYALPAELLTLELTESSIMTDPAKALDVLNRLRDLGARLSIDDFGTGYSSLSYLRRLPVAALKIDRSFVSGTIQDSEASRVCGMIIDLADSLGLHVVAEGIEDVATWNAMRDLGCDTAQGYFISRPFPAEQLRTWHAAWEPPRALLANASRA